MALTALSPGHAQGAPGDLDPGFGTGGRVTTKAGAVATNDNSRAVVTGSDGTTIVAGETPGASPGSFGVGLVRYLPDGGLDPSFGNGGRVVTDLATTGELEVEEIVMLDDGRIVVAGGMGPTNGQDFLLVGFTENGELDPEFGEGGVARTDFGVPPAICWDLAATNDRLVCAGETGVGEYRDFALARYDLEGQLDPTFGTGGRATASWAPGSSDRLRGVAVLEDDSIVIAGSTDAAGARVPVAKFNSLGQYDATFGVAGRSIADSGGSFFASDVIVQPDGKIVAVGGNGGTSGGDFAAVRLTTTGALDSGFGQGSGLATVEFPGEDATARSVALAPGGEIVVAGESGARGRFDYAVARLMASGLPDPSFGIAGKATSDTYRDSYDEPQDMALDSLGRVVLTGDTFEQHFVTLRYLPDGTLDQSWGDGGKLYTIVWLRFRSPVVDAQRQADGRLVVVAETSGVFERRGEGDILVARYLTNGDLDPSFGLGGLSPIDLGSDEHASAVAIQPRGRIVVAGYARRESSRDILLVGLRADGLLDPGFGLGGSAIADVGPFSRANAVAVEPGTESIVVGGTTRFTDEPELHDAVLARFTADGALDPTFSGDGSAIFDFGVGDRIADLATPGGGSIVAAGGSSDFVVSRYSSSGALDPSFGTGGLVRTNFSGSGTSASTDTASAVDLAPDGGVVVAGSTVPGQAPRVQTFALARYASNGALDPQFGGGGTVVPFPGVTGSLSDIEADSANLLAVGGTRSGPDGLGDFAALKLGGNGSPDSSFAGDGLSLVDLGGADSAAAVSPGPDGAVTLAGTIRNPDNSQLIALAQLQATPPPPVDSPVDPPGPVATVLPPAPGIKNPAEKADPPSIRPSKKCKKRKGAKKRKCRPRRR